jgi:hypothetical protein
MDNLLCQLFNTYISYDIIDDNEVSKFRNQFDKLLKDYFSEVKNHIKNLSENKSSAEIIKYISKEKDKVREYKEKLLTKEYVMLNTPPLTVEEHQTRFDMSKEDAIKSICYKKIHKIQFDIMNKSYSMLMALHRKYSDDLLIELRRFDIDFWGYNDVPFEDIFNESSNCLQWLNRLFNEYFDKLTSIINEKKDLNEINTLINTKIKIFNQIKNELSEKGDDYLIDKKEKFEKIKDTDENKTGEYQRAAFMFVCSELLYKKQHQYIDEALSKLEKLHESYLPKLSSATIRQQNQLQPQISENILNELEKEKLITKEPLKWVGAVNLCAYFVDCYFAKSSPNDLWKKGQTLFNVRNLRQSKYNYSGNKTTNGKPKNYQTIDDILEKNR